MAAPRNVTAAGENVWLSRDLENGGAVVEEEEEDSPSAKKPKWEKFPFNTWEFGAAIGVFFVFSTGLFCIYLTMPPAEYGHIKLPRTLSDLRLLKDNLSTYAKNHRAQFILGYCSTYIFMQTFMIPGTIFMSLLAGALFGVVRGILLVVFNATAGASSCFFLSKLIGRPIVSWLWPDKLRFFQAEIDTPVNFLPFPSLTYAGKSLSIVLAPTVVIQGTPLWRNGPPEKPVLCNACGSRWRTKGTLANYTPLHARAETGNEDQRVSRVMSLSLNKKKEVKLVKRKMGQTDNAVSGGLAPDYNRGFQKVVDEDTCNRSTTVATTTSVLISLYTLLVCMVII